MLYALSKTFWYSLYDIEPETEIIDLFSQWIRFGWVGAAFDEPEDVRVLQKLIEHLHKYKEHPNQLALYRAARQLFALGLFRNTLLPVEDCSHCAREMQSEPHVPEIRVKCSCALVCSLECEFACNPLSLHQLSRMAIRRSLGMNNFESPWAKLGLKNWVG